MPECPVHKNVELQIPDKVGGLEIREYAERVGIWQCPHSEDYWKMTDEGWTVIEEGKLISDVEKYREMKKKMEEERTEVELAGIPSRIERQQMEVAREQLSETLWRFVREEPGKHRAYTVNEIITACTAIGLDPKKVRGHSISYVRQWLFDNLGQFESKR